MVADARGAAPERAGLALSFGATFVDLRALRMWPSPMSSDTQHARHAPGTRVPHSSWALVCRLETLLGAVLCHRLAASMSAGPSNLVPTVLGRWPVAS